MTTEPVPRGRAPRGSTTTEEKPEPPPSPPALGAAPAVEVDGRGPLNRSELVAALRNG